LIEVRAFRCATLCQQMQIARDFSTSTARKYVGKYEVFVCDMLLALWFSFKKT
jgi:hypothetical protein